LIERREWRRTLHLRGLPRMLCNLGCLEAYLEKNGLLEAVMSIRVRRAQGQAFGHAVITAVSIDKVPPLVKLFHGRRFGRSIPVAVSFAANQSTACGVSASTSAGVAKVGGGALGNCKEPRRVFQCSRKEAEGSESTASCSPRESVSLESESSSRVDVIELPPGLALPVGLTR